MFNTDENGVMAVICLVWLATIVYVARLCVRVPGQSAGLPAAFCFATTFLYLGAFTFAVPGYSHERLDAHFYLAGFGVGHESIVRGAALTCAALISFAIGVRFMMGQALLNTTVSPRYVFSEPPFRLAMMILVGLALLGVLIPISGIRFPLSQAIGSVGHNANLALICVGIYKARVNQSVIGKILFYTSAIILPIYYLLVFGFVSHGFIASIIILMFIVASSSRQQWTYSRLFLATIIIGYILASLCVLYFTSRDELRSVIWGGQSYGLRVTTLFDVLRDVEPLNPADFASLDRINMRLSQTAFVGRTIDWHAQYPELRQYGATLFLFVFAWVPRFLWPGKPSMGTSTVLEENTGLTFSSGTTFGAGPIIELYSNFGTSGVLVGFFLFGLILAKMDLMAMSYLRAGFVLGFAKFFVVGVALIAPLTDFFFFANSMAIAWIVITLLQASIFNNGRTRLLGSSYNRSF